MYDSTPIFFCDNSDRAQGQDSPTHSRMDLCRCLDGVSPSWEEGAWNIRGEVFIQLDSTE